MTWAICIQRRSDRKAFVNKKFLDRDEAVAYALRMSRGLGKYRIVLRCWP